MTKLMNRNDPQLDGLFRHTQGNILKGHGREHTANIFIQCDPHQQAAVKNWLRSLIATNIVTSAKEQLDETAQFKATGEPGKMFATILISAEGYKYLGFDPGDGFSEEFERGMKRAGLNDPDHNKWQYGFRDAIHFLLLIGSENQEKIFVATELFKTEIEKFGSVMTVEYGNALRNKPRPGELKGAGIEHFGYVDGTSQPLFFEDELEKYKEDNGIKDDKFIYNPSADRSLVLVKDPLSGAADAFGSYFVFRKLEQDVRGFKEHEEALAEDLGLVKPDDERAGAMIVGRFEDGTPVQVQPTDGLAKSAVQNNFDYQLNDNSKCPFHAHIRKTNPRSASPFENLEGVQKHVMARRGIPFGTRSDDPNDGEIDNKPTGGVGLLFMSYQADLANQFEFIQKNWANNPEFPFQGGGTNHPTSGLDPIIGQLPDGKNISTGAFPVVYGDLKSLKTKSFEHFLKMRGGEYFFAPSISFLQQLN